MKKILVTGSNGLLGQKLTDKFLKNPDYQLINTSKGEDRYPTGGNYVYVSLDITNESELNKVIEQHRPDAVINTAAMTNVDACESQREECWKLNVESVQYLVNAAEKYHFHLIHLSTDFIFDGENGPYIEEDAPNPLSYYGKSKWEAEKIILKSKCDYAILRTIIVYGVAANMSRSNIVLWAKDALEKKQTINVVNDQYRMPTLAEDLADACILAIEKKAKGIYHTSGKDFMSVLQMVERIADFFDLDKKLINPISSASLNQAAKRPPRTGFILDRSIKELNYHPHSFEEGLKIVQEQLLKKN
jgi:dTDP-4-dehydrorhamnose reductase